MDWSALWLSIELGVATLLVLLPLALVMGRWLAFTRIRGKPVIEALLAVPLVLPPTVVGYYLLVAFGGASPLGRWLESAGFPMVFSFSGLVLASVLVNVPFAVQPIQRAFESIPDDVRDAAATCGLSRWQAFRRIELPLAWPGVITGLVLTLAHTLGEFGVVLMVGGSIPGETRTIAISIYDRVQSFDFGAAGTMSLVLLVSSIVALTIAARLGQPSRRRTIVSP